jgi:hypothetical protein
MPDNALTGQVPLTLALTPTTPNRNSMKKSRNPRQVNKKEW